MSNPHYENLDLAQNVVEVTFSTKPLKQSERLAVVSGTDNCNGDSSVTVNNAKSSPNLAVTLTEYGVDVAEKSSIEILAKVFFVNVVVKFYNCILGGTLLTKYF